MMIRWLLACSLALCCSLAVGCSSGDAVTDAGPKAPNEESPASKDAKKDLEAVKTSLVKARDSIKNAQRQTPAATDTPRPSPTTKRSKGGQESSSSEDASDDPTTTKAAQNVISEAMVQLKEVDPPLGSLKKALAGQSGTQERDKSIETVEASVDEAVIKLEGASASAKLVESSSDQRAKLNQSLKDALELVESKALTAANNVKIPNDLKASSSWSVSLINIFIWVAIILGSILGLVLLIGAGRALMKSSSARADARIKTKIQPLASTMQKQQVEVASQIADLTTSQNELRTRVAELEFEIKKVARIARDAAAHDGAGRRPLAPTPAFSSFEEPVERDEPVFPISIGDYLSKMQRSTNIVRPDFQNDILVSDPGGTGELILIRDAAIADDLQPLFVVPRATQFQTKQDFYTYYQKYYECARPSAGDVWIIDPAVVSKVSGGWQLREKGVLEVR